MLLIALCILTVIIVHVYADSPKVPPEPKTGRKQSTAVSRARASIKATGTCTYASYATYTTHTDDTYNTHTHTHTHRHDTHNTQTRHTQHTQT